MSILYIFGVNQLLDCWPLFRQLCFGYKCNHIITQIVCSTNFYPVKWLRQHLFRQLFQLFIVKQCKFHICRIFNAYRILFDNLHYQRLSFLKQLHTFYNNTPNYSRSYIPQLISISLNPLLSQCSQLNSHADQIFSLLFEGRKHRVNLR